MKDTNKTFDVFGLIIYVIAAVFFGATGQWLTCIAWAACAIVQGTVMAVRSNMQNTINTLLEDRDWYKSHSEETLKAAQDVTKLNEDILKTSQELNDSNKEYLEDLQCLHEVVKEMQSYLTIEELMAVNRQVEKTGYQFSNVNVPGGEYELFINRDMRPFKFSDDE